MRASWITLFLCLLIALAEKPGNSTGEIVSGFPAYATDWISPDKFPLQFGDAQVLGGFWVRDGVAGPVLLVTPEFETLPGVDGYAQDSIINSTAGFFIRAATQWEPFPQAIMQSIVINDVTAQTFITEILNATTVNITNATTQFFTTNILNATDIHITNEDNRNYFYTTNISEIFEYLYHVTQVEQFPVMIEDEMLGKPDGDRVLFSTSLPIWNEQIEVGITYSPGNYRALYVRDRDYVVSGTDEIQFLAPPPVRNPYSGVIYDATIYATYSGYPYGGGGLLGDVDLPPE
jgi:hypothetical protein